MGFSGWEQVCDFDSIRSVASSLWWARAVTWRGPPVIATSLSNWLAEVADEEDHLILNTWADMGLGSRWHWARQVLERSPKSPVAKEFS